MPTTRRTVAVVVPHYPPYVGGVEAYTAHLVAALKETGDLWPVVVTVGAEGRSTSVEDGVVVERLAPWARVSNTPVNPWWIVQVRQLLDRHHVDVVNAHSPVPFLADVATYAAGRRPTVLTYHSGSLVKGVGWPVDAVLRAYERVVLPRVMRRADRLVAVSPVATTFATGRATLVPPGVDSARFVPGPPPTERLVTFVGRLGTHSRWKGVATLLEAFARLRDPAAVLQLVGDGDDVPTLEASAQRLGISRRVRWRGALHGEDLVRAYQESTVVVLPSLTESESFGMTLVEAMACGRPVVGSRVGGIPFVVRDGVDGLLVPPGDAAALASTLDALLDDPEQQVRLGRAGREAAVTRWDWSHSTARGVEVLREALSGAAPRGSAGLEHR